VDEKGQTFLNDQAVTVAQLKTDLQQMKSDNPDLSVVVKGADNVDYQNMINVLDVLQQLTSPRSAWLRPRQINKILKYGTNTNDHETHSRSIDEAAPVLSKNLFVPACSRPTRRLAG
jgi:hypothetical protein